MKRIVPSLLLLAMLSSLAVELGLQSTQPSGRWVATWTAAPMNTRPSDMVVAGFHNQTVREIVRVSIGGQRIRIRLSNEYGSRPVPIQSIHVALANVDGTIQTASDRPVTFGGLRSVTLLAGAPMLSDSIELSVSPLAHLAVSTYFKEWAPVESYHFEAQQTAFLSTLGDSVRDEKFVAGQTTTSHYFLSGVFIECADDARTVVALGDSITDGYLSTINGDRRYPDRLAERVLADNGLKNVAVVNQGIGGNRLLSDGRGASALARFDRDVLSLPHVSHVVLLEGINDIGWPGTILDSEHSEPTLDTLASGYRQLIARAHAHGIKVILATIVPFEGNSEDKQLPSYFSADKERLRLQVNDWIRRNHEVDGVVDFDLAIRDPARPGCMRREFDSGDGIHPNDAGYKAMADAVDLAMLRR